MPTHKYEKIVDHLRSAIVNGTYAPGDMLPSSRVLCEQWGVSRHTAVKAAEVLRDEGLAEAVQGTGTRVVAMPLARPAGRRGATTNRTQGAGPFQRLGTPEMKTPPPHITDALDLDAGEQALHRARLVLTPEGDSPHSLVTAWFPPDVASAAPRLSGAGPLPEGTTRHVLTTTGRAPAHGYDTYTVRLATKEEAELLKVERPCAVAVALHVARDANDQPLVCEEGVTPQQMWQIEEDYPMGSTL
ncbi:GntR family transcriptional regulator [Streptomyces noursei]